MTLKRYQVVLLFFALGVFGLASWGIYRDYEKKDVLILKPEAEYRTLNVYFLNSAYDPKLLDCSNVYPVERVIKRLSTNNRSALGEFAYLILEELLKGPSEHEKSIGFVSSINNDSKIQNIAIEGDIAKVDFNSRFNEIGGSCNVQAIRSQVTSTLLQFNEIKEVIISVDGEFDEILQP